MNLARSTLAHVALAMWVIMDAGISHFHSITRGLFTNKRPATRVVKHLVRFDPGKCFAAYASGASLARSHWGKTGDYSTIGKHISKTAGWRIGRNVPSIRHVRDVLFSPNIFSITVAKINHCLCTRMAPTPVVYS